MKRTFEITRYYKVEINSGNKKSTFNFTEEELVRLKKTIGAALITREPIFFNDSPEVDINES